MTKFAEELRKAIETKVVTISELARLTGVSRMHIYRLMRGEMSPSLDTAEAIARHIGIRLKIEQSR